MNYSEEELRCMANDPKNCTCAKPARTRGDRLSVEARKAQIVAAAYQIAVDVGLLRVTQELVAERVGVTRTLVTGYFKADDLRAAVVEHAVNAISVDTAHRNDYLRIISSGYFMSVPAALNAPDEIKRAAVKLLLV